jgi:hypothetical protein
MGFFERITQKSVPKLPHNFNLSVNRGTQNRVPFGSVGSIPSAGTFLCASRVAGWIETANLVARRESWFVRRENQPGPEALQRLFPARLLSRRETASAEL